ncbi:hypothetical protein AMS68_002053 [Peltaster fructicola]|uniref:Potassium channel tetramerisation-type BTB domain-containing protein n=1 Tax=Peltaster fructicola TaxID=286661 RepID=A0A6H0XPC6_9PEZI|nr:hypothetical protein AMS68_002053 [Peltaster fructicola]
MMSTRGTTHDPPTRTDWEWDMPDPAIDHQDATPLARLSDCDAVGNDLPETEFTAMHSTTIPGAGLSHITPARRLKRKSLVEAVDGTSSKRASVATTEIDDELVELSPTSMLPGQSIARLSQLPGLQDRMSAVAARPDMSNATTQAVNVTSAAGTPLPPKKIFTIQVGDRLFRLSGASISSDAPSYFTRYFVERAQQNSANGSGRTLYIDRDPNTFSDIARHLQGYHIEPQDGPHYVKLFADAQFFSLPRLTAQLFSSDIHIKIGGQNFQITRDVFNRPGDSPNYFTLGFSTSFTGSTHTTPELLQSSYVRPPSIVPPTVPNRSASSFADLLHMLKGYELTIRDESHRADLLRDARYFHFKGLEQRLIPHKITYNLARQRSEILLRPGDIRKEGLSVQGDTPASPTPGWIVYQRPHVDQEARTLIIEIGGDESAILSIASPIGTSGVRLGRLSFYGKILDTINRLFGLITSKSVTHTTLPSTTTPSSNLRSVPPSPSVASVSDEKVKVRIGPDADLTVNGRKWPFRNADSDGDDRIETSSATAPGRTMPRRTSSERIQQEGLELVLSRSQWRIRVQPSDATADVDNPAVEIILGAVKIDGFSNERAWNAAQSFLG